MIYSGISYTHLQLTMKINIVFILYLIGFGYCLPLEPVCSKFDYDYKTLEAMIRTERFVEDMKKEMLKIQQDVSEKLQQIDDFRLKQKDVITTIGDQMDEKASEMKTEILEMRVDVSSKLKKLAEQEDAFGQLKKQVDENTLRSSDVIAFSVADATRNHVNGVPTFSRVITNIGDGYNQATGKFTCTVPGLYLFTFTIRHRATKCKHVLQNPAELERCRSQPNKKTRLHNSIQCRVFDAG